MGAMHRCQVRRRVHGPDDGVDQPQNFNQNFTPSRSAVMMRPSSARWSIGMGPAGMLTAPSLKMTLMGSAGSNTVGLPSAAWKAPYRSSTMSASGRTHTDQFDGLSSSRCSSLSSYSGFSYLTRTWPTERSVTTQQLHAVVDSVVVICDQTAALIELSMMEFTATTTAF